MAILQDRLSIVSTQRKSAAAGTEPGGSRARGSRQRQRLIDACIAALHLYGPSRTTVEKVVAIADLSPGIVRFYFDSKDAMLVASLGYLAAEFDERVLQPVARLKDSPVRALELLVDLDLDPQLASTRKISVWYSFWASVRPLLISASTASAQRSRVKGSSLRSAAEKSLSTKAAASIRPGGRPMPKRVR